MIRYLHFNHKLAKSVSRDFRKRFQNRTVAALALDKGQIENIANAFIGFKPVFKDEQMYTRLGIGVAMLHPKDQYDKALGRNAAHVNMKEVNLEVKEVFITKTHIYVGLESYRGVRLKLRVNKVTGYSTVSGSLEGEA